MKSKDWYINEYGEEWAEIIRELDLEEAVAKRNMVNKVILDSVGFDRSTSWAFNEVSGQ